MRKIQEKTKKIRMLRIKEGRECLEDQVIVEYSLSIYLNGRYFITLLCTPDSLEELTVGYLYSESVISSMEDLENLEIDEVKGKALVRLKSEDIFSYMGDNLISKKTVTTGCGRGRTITFPVVADGNEKKIHPLEVDPDRIIELMNLFNRRSELFESTGGVHSCALCNYSGIIYFEDDIGRHNALDKILGRALMDGLVLSDKIVLTTGRMSSEITDKVIKRGIPMLVSRSAPTDKAIEAAEKSGLKLIGFVRGRRMNIYT